MTELDEKNIFELNKKFKNNNKIKVIKENIENINQKFDAIIYLHVLEHIKNDKNEIKKATSKLNKNGFFNNNGSCSSKNIW